MPTTEDLSKYAAEDVTPSWADTLRLYRRMYPSLNAEGRGIMDGQLDNMAKLADAHVAYTKGQQPANQLVDFLNLQIFVENDLSGCQPHVDGIEEIIQSACTKVGIDFIETDEEKGVFIIECSDRQTELKYHLNEDEEVVDITIL